MKESSTHKRSLREDRLLEQRRSGKFYGYVQYDFEVPEELKKKFAKLAPILEKTNVGRHDIRILMKVYAEKEGLLGQPRRMLISSYFLENETLITPLILFYLYLGLVCRKTNRLVDYIPVKSFNKFVQSAVNARLEGHGNPNLNEIACYQLLRLSIYGS